MKNLIRKLLYKTYGFLRSNFYAMSYLKYKEKYTINKSFRFNGEDILFYGDGEIIINEESYIGSLSTIQAIKGTKVAIGKHCMISHNVRIYTSSLYGDQDLSLDDSNFRNKNADVIIGNYVWIGANVFINPGVTIGDNSVIGANSVITKNIPANSIYGGVPAKLIKMKQ